MDLSINDMKGRRERPALASPRSVVRIAPLIGLCFGPFFCRFSIFDKTSKQARGMNGHLEGFKHIITSVIVHE